MKYDNLLNLNPDVLKKMSEAELELLSHKIRDFLLENVSKTGGHLASNLGVVELTIALHYVFNSPEDKIIWDTGHQSYVHKILTGRASQFSTLRQYKGLSGFPKRNESEHDIYDSGHASTSVSVGFGHAVSRDFKGENNHVITVIGDGSMTGGVAFEALNNAAELNTKMIILLNDNEMSIEKNHGGLNRHLSRLRTSKQYQDVKKQIKKTFHMIPVVGDGIINVMSGIRDSLKYVMIHGAIFEEMDIAYLGPVDGHNIKSVIEALEVAKKAEKTVLIHAITKKGKGYDIAEENPSKFHGIGAFEKKNGEKIEVGKKVTYSEIFGNTLIELAEKDEKIVAISAAMVEGTGLDKFRQRFPERLFDVGIAEQHAVSFAAGLAAGGMKPVVAIYSTFLQRAYDQIIEDVCLSKLPVVFMLDRAGIVGPDGETHHGILDISYLSDMPEMTVMAPKDAYELKQMMNYAFSLNSPVAIRYPRGKAISINQNEFMPCAEILNPEIKKPDVTIISVGKMVKTAIEAEKLLKEKGIKARIINARFIKPIDQNMVLGIDSDIPIVTLEDNSVSGGFGSKLLFSLNELGTPPKKYMCLGWPDQFIAHGKTTDLEDRFQLSPQAVSKQVENFLERKKKIRRFTL